MRDETPKQTARIAPALLVTLFAAGCGSYAYDEAAPDEASSVDASAPTATLDAGPSTAIDADTPEDTPDAPTGTPFTLTQNTNPAQVNPARAFGCHDSSNTPWITRENGYLRRFNLGSSGFSDEFRVESVRFGITEAMAGNAAGTQPVSVRIFRVQGAFVAANMTLLSEKTVGVADQSTGFFSIPISATIPAQASFAVEIFVEDGRSEGNTLTLGFNDSGESAPTYIRAPCNDAIEPLDIDTIHPFYEDFHLLMEVRGRFGS